MEAWDWVRAVLALVATMALILLAGYGARRFNWLPNIAGGAGKRLSVLETLPLDPRRRLILVRCDGLDHLLLLSPHGDRAIAAFGQEKPKEPANPMEVTP